MALLTLQQIGVTGTAPNYVAASAGGDTIPPDDDGFLHVKNGSGAGMTVTVVTPGNGPGGIAVPDIAVAVPAGGDRFIGPLNAALMDPSTGTAGVTYSATAGVTIAALRV